MVLLCFFAPVPEKEILDFIARFNYSSFYGIITRPRRKV